MFSKRGFANRGVGRKRRPLETGDFDPGENPFIENMKVAPLVPEAETTHYSTGNGNWSDIATWSAGSIPGADDKVLIRSSDTVIMDHDNMARIKWVRVDGTLRWDTSPGQTLRMCVDTLVVDDEGTLEIGTELNPIPESSLAEIHFADNGPIDLNYDKWLISRGLLCFGASTLHGFEKTPFVEMAADTLAGANTIELASVPVGWVAGDKLAVAPTLHIGRHYKNNANRWVRTQSEEAEILSIVGSTITLTAPLVYARTGRTFADPDDRLVKKTYRPHVANLSRNVRVCTENVADLFPIYQRGHVMFMRGPTPTVPDWRFVEHYGLGRTDKTQVSIDAATLPSSNTQSLQGRYAHHYHFLGTSKEDQQNPPILTGCTAWGPLDTRNPTDGNVNGRTLSQWRASPGWAFVQHGSGSSWYENVVFGAYGAAYVAEDGSETGTWNENCAIWCHGEGNANPKNADNKVLFSGGAGLATKSRMVRAKANILADCTMGAALFHRFTSDFSIETVQHPLLVARNADAIQASDVNTDFNVPVNSNAINFWDENIGYACRKGFTVVKANPKQQHDFWSLLENNVMWNCEEGYHSEYTAHYLWKDNHSLAAPSAPSGRSIIQGFSSGSNTYDQFWSGGNIEGHRYGIKFGDGWTTGSNIQEPGFVAYDVSFTNIENPDDPVFTDPTNKPWAPRWTYYPDFASIPNNPVSISQTSFTADANGEWSMDGVTVNDGFRTNKLLNELPYDPATNGLGEDMGMRRDGTRFILRNLGYWTKAGSTVMFVPFWVTDTFTARRTVIGLEVNMDLPSWTAEWGALNGVWADDGAPIRTDIFVSTPEATPLEINVITGAVSPGGWPLSLLSSNRTAQAEVIDMGDGERILYRPDQGFTGVDTFDCWITDNKSFTRFSVEVEVT